MISPTGKQLCSDSSQLLKSGFARVYVIIPLVLTRYGTKNHFNDFFLVADMSFSGRVRVQIDILASHGTRSQNVPCGTIIVDVCHISGCVGRGYTLGSSCENSPAVATEVTTPRGKRNGAKRQVGGGEKRAFN